MEENTSESARILQVLAQFCRAIDREDRDGIVACFWPDAVIDLGALVWSAVEFADSPLRRDPRNLSAHHQLGQSVLHIADDSAACESYFIYAGLRRESDQTETVTDLRGRFLDQFAKREGEWRIAGRKLIVDFIHEFQRQAKSPEEKSPYLEGAPNPSDPSYSLFSA